MIAAHEPNTIGTGVFKTYDDGTAATTQPARQPRGLRIFVCRAEPLPDPEPGEFEPVRLPHVAQIPSTGSTHFRSLTTGRCARSGRVAAQLGSAQFQRTQGVISRR